MVRDRPPISQHQEKPRDQKTIPARSSVISLTDDSSLIQEPPLPLPSEPQSADEPDGKSSKLGAEDKHQTKLSPQSEGPRRPPQLKSQAQAQAHGQALRDGGVKMSPKAQKGEGGALASTSRPGGSSRDTGGGGGLGMAQGVPQHAQFGVASPLRNPLKQQQQQQQQQRTSSSLFIPKKKPAFRPVQPVNTLNQSRPDSSAASTTTSHDRGFQLPQRPPPNVPSQAASTWDAVEAYMAGTPVKKTIPSPSKDASVFEIAPPTNAKRPAIPLRLVRSSRPQLVHVPRSKLSVRRGLLLILLGLMARPMDLIPTERYARQGRNLVSPIHTCTWMRARRTRTSRIC